VRFRDAYTKKPPFYLDGVGTRGGFVGKLLGGLTGAGGFIRISRKGWRRWKRTLPAATAMSISSVLAAARRWRCISPTKSTMK